MVKIAAFVVLGGCWLVVSGASTSIGTIRSTGGFTVDGSGIQGNSTLFAGNTIETFTAESRIRLGNLDLALHPRSRVRVYADHTTLEKGSGVVTGSPKYSVEAEKMRIASRGDGSVWQVAVNGPGQISVTARKGNAEVRNSEGMLLAVVRPGIPLAFAPQAGGANTAVQISGIVQMEGGNYFIVNSATNMRMELRGNNLSQYVGKNVNVSGSVIPGATAAGDATQVVQVATIRPLPSVPSPGISTPTSAPVGVIAGGAVVAGTIIGLAASGEFNGSATVPALSSAGVTPTPLSTP